jgi:hypothetical protein
MLYPIILLAIAILVLANPPPPPNLGRWLATALAIVAIIVAAVGHRGPW